jgi:hypothetical protein
MKKIYLTVDKEWLLENYPKMTLKEMCDNKILQDKPFGSYNNIYFTFKKINKYENNRSN